MLCLCGKPTDGFWRCVQDPSCGFSCPKGEEWLYDRAVKKFLATKQDRPKCCAVTPEASERNDTKFKVLLPPNGAGVDLDCSAYTFPNFGCPYFACPKEKDRCTYFAQGDKAIVDVPLCQHVKPCNLLSDCWSKGPNKGRWFLSCPELRKNSCGFFQWVEPEDYLWELDGKKVDDEFRRLDKEYPCSISSCFEWERQRHMKRFEVTDEMRRSAYRFFEM